MTPRYFGSLKRLAVLIVTDYNSSVGMDMTPQQEKVFQALADHGFISHEYFNLTKQRQKVHEQEKETRQR